MRVVDLIMASMAEGVGVELVKELEGDGGDGGGNPTASREKRKLDPFAAVASPNKTITR